jgi:hypothetical protein
MDFSACQLVIPQACGGVSEEGIERGHQQRPCQHESQFAFHDHFSFSINAAPGSAATSSNFDWRFGYLSKRRYVLCYASQSGQSDWFNRCR